MKKAHAPEQAAIDLSAKYTAAERQVGWAVSPEDDAFDFQELFGATEQSSFYAYFRLQSPSSQPVLLRTKSDDARTRSLKVAQEIKYFEERYGLSRNVNTRDLDAEARKVFFSIYQVAVADYDKAKDNITAANQSLKRMKALADEKGVPEGWRS